MPQWSTTPPLQSAEFSYRLIRAPACRPIALTLISSKPQGTYTHYTKGRTLPCDGDGCSACKEGHPYRWHAYLAARVDGTREKVILELTAQAAEQLLPALNEFKTLRAVAILLERPARRPNGRIRITIAPGRRPENDLPPEPDIQRMMLHIWGLDDTSLTSRPGKHHFQHLTKEKKHNGEVPQNPSTLP